MQVKLEWKDITTEDIGIKRMIDYYEQLPPTNWNG